jgi:hypothetical protein
MTTPATPSPWRRYVARRRLKRARIASDIARAQRTEAQIRAIVRDEISKGGM